MAVTIPPVVTNFAAGAAQSALANSTSSSEGSSGDKTKKFIDMMLRSSFDAMIKGACKGQIEAEKKRCSSGGTWKAATMPSPDVSVDLYADPNKKE